MLSSLVSWTWKLAKTVYYEIAWSQPIRSVKFWEGLCYFCVRRLSLTLLWVCASLGYFWPLGNMVHETNTDESLTMCLNIWANEKTRFHGTGSGFCQTDTILGLVCYLFFDPIPSVSSFSWKCQRTWPMQIKESVIFRI